MGTDHSTSVSSIRTPMYVMGGGHGIQLTHTQVSIPTSTACFEAACNLACVTTIIIAKGLS